MRAKLTTTALALTLIVPGLALAQQQSGATNPPAAATAPGASGMSTSPTVGTTAPSTTHDTMGATGTRTQGADTAAGDTGTMSNTSPATTTAVDNPLYNMKGEQIVGQNVYGPNGEEIGEIDNVVMSKEGKQAAAVIGVGGFLGIGERKVAIPLDQLHMGTDNKLTTSMTKDQINSMQPYEESGWSKLDPSGTIHDWMNR
ncbi:PRC-barrel domain-containing protein [Benzoatithermus flavus]|uniref:PRC-barrel domain-containing protein n=1 Tax=Benzoatithermus flavus TaxID=3108223 RepID=A0ABU8XK32_9PROT